MLSFAQASKVSNLDLSIWNYRRLIKFFIILLLPTRISLANILRDFFPLWHTLNFYQWQQKSAAHFNPRGVSVNQIWFRTRHAAPGSTFAHWNFIFANCWMEFLDLLNFWNHFWNQNSDSVPVLLHFLDLQHYFINFFISYYAIFCKFLENFPNFTLNIDIFPLQFHFFGISCFFPNFYTFLEFCFYFSTCYIF